SSFGAVPALLPCASPFGRGTETLSRRTTMNLPAPGAEPRHVSVLPAAVLELLAPAPGEILVDATVGAGGHSRLLAERLAPTGRLIGLDCDPAMLDRAR